MDRLTNHLFVISIDCLSALDLPILQELPSFQNFLHKGALVRNVRSVYPSVTYPCHTSIVTGNFPNKHGITNNTLLQPDRISPDWHWYRSSIQGTTLYDEAKKANMTTAALLWPVTGKANIDFNLPEIFPNRPWQNQILVSLLNGSPLYQLVLNHRYGYLRNGLHQPELDDFVLESTVYTIKRKKPNLLLVHFTDLDSQRHHHGFSSKEAISAIQRLNSRIERIIEAINESGLMDQSTIVVLGDHSALDENKAINLNALFVDNNLISINAKGKLVNWKVYSKSCDGSAYIYIKHKEDTETFRTVKQILYELLDNQESGIEKVLTSNEAAEMGADQNCSFMIEAQKGYYFLEEYTGAYIKEITKENVNENKRYTLSTHGYSPEKSAYSTIFMAYGRGIRNVELPSIQLVDEGPTLARLVGVHLGNTDGQIIKELLSI